MANRDRHSDTSRTGRPMSRGEAMSDVDVGPASLADEAWADAAEGRRSVGTASDDADVTGEIHRRQYRRRRGPNQPG